MSARRGVSYGVIVGCSVTEDVSHDASETPSDTSPYHIYSRLYFWSLKTGEEKTNIEIA